MKSLQHITLTTGASRMSAREEVDDEAVNTVRRAIALADGVIPDTEWVVRLIPTPEGAYVYRLFSEGMSIVTCFLAASPDVSDDLWKTASSMPVLPGTINHQPDTTPWLAVIMAPDEAILANPTIFASILTEVGDLERVVAWALLE